MLATNYKWICTAVIFVIAACPSTLGDITLYPQEILVEIKTHAQFTIETRNFTKSNVTLTFVAQHGDLIRTSPSMIILQPGNEKYPMLLEGLDAGHSELFTTSSDPEIQVDKLYLVANIYKSKTVDIISQISGWIYFIAWGLSYYPQIVVNFKRKSVIGLSFDYLGFNIIGYISFGIFIQSMYFSPAIQDEYFEKNSRGLIPVKINDVVYNLNGFFAVSVTIIQCFIYERGGQVVSITGRVILSLFACFYLVLFILRATSVIQWLNFIYYCSYLKLVITILKYIPQAYMNYVRKSTVGWSIEVVILNLIGGICSLGQMLFDSYNYNDWLSILGNPTKFGLGMFTVLFQILFMIQHYVLYRHKVIDTKI